MLFVTAFGLLANGEYEPFAGEEKEDEAGAAELYEEVLDAQDDWYELVTTLA